MRMVADVLEHIHRGDLNVFSAETVCNIAKFCERLDCMNLRLVTGLSPEVGPKMYKKDWRIFNIEFEKRLRARKLNSTATVLTCTQCCRLKARRSFADCERRKKVENKYGRQCFGCLPRVGNFQFDGQEAFYCFLCHKALPLFMEREKRDPNRTNEEARLEAMRTFNAPRHCRDCNYMALDGMGPGKNQDLVVHPPLKQILSPDSAFEILLVLIDCCKDAGPQSLHNKARS